MADVVVKNSSFWHRLHMNQRQLPLRRTYTSRQEIFMEKMYGIWHVEVILRAVIQTVQQLSPCLTTELGCVAVGMHGCGSTHTTTENFWVPLKGQCEQSEESTRGLQWKGPKGKHRVLCLYRGQSALHTSYCNSRN